MTPQCKEVLAHINEHGLHDKEYFMKHAAMRRIQFMDAVKQLKQTHQLTTKGTHEFRYYCIVQASGEQVAAYLKKVNAIEPASEVAWLYS